MRTSGWGIAVRVAAGIGRLTPALALSLFLVVTVAAFLDLGTLLVAVWLLTGFAVLTRVGEQAARREVLRYRPATGSWLAADVATLTPGRRLQVWIASALTRVRHRSRSATNCRCCGVPVHA